jgi:two-component system OmpR family response regulator
MLSRPGGTTMFSQQMSRPQASSLSIGDELTLTFSHSLGPDMGGRPAVLLVENDKDLAAEILNNLRQERYSATYVESGPEGLAACITAPPNLLIADRTLPGFDGLSLIKALRSEGIRVPVLVLSALSTVDERIRGLKAGADDYLTQPFAMGELLARVEALLRRPVEIRESILSVGALKMDLIERTVRRGTRDLELVPREFKLLEYMMRRPGRAVTRAKLFEDVWGYRFTPRSNVIDVHIGHLRRKVDGPNEAPMIRSVYRVGFALDAIS